jgi:hypothetical protein
MRSVRFPAGPAEDDAISSAGGCGAGLRSRPPTGRRDGLADRGELRGNVFMETATARGCRPPPAPQPAYHPCTPALPAPDRASTRA